MNRDRNAAEHYRLRAEEVRTLAEMDEHCHTRELLLSVAGTYERMAITYENIYGAGQPS